MWGNSVWGIAQTAITLLLAWLGVTQPTPLADLYLVGAAILGAASIVVLIWPLLRRRMKVDASHLIILIGLCGGVISLVLVTGGYAWQMFRQSAAAAGPVAPSNQRTARNLSPAEQDERSKALLAARNIALKARAFYEKNNTIQQNDRLGPLVQDDSAPSILQGFADDFKPIADEMQEFAKTYREWFPDIDRALLGAPTTSQVLGIYVNTTNLKQEIIAWRDRPDRFEHIWRSRTFEAWLNSVRALPDWLSQATNNINKLRREDISQ